MSILRNACVALSILRVKGPNHGSHVRLFRSATAQIAFALLRWHLVLVFYQSEFQGEAQCDSRVNIWSEMFLFDV